MENAGFENVLVLKGGWKAWMDADYPVDEKPRE